MRETERERIKKEQEKRKGKGMNSEKASGENGGYRNEQNCLKPFCRN